jgi:hypothetical protein
MSKVFTKASWRVSQVTQRQKMKVCLGRFFTAVDSPIQDLERFATHFQRGGQLTCWCCQYLSNAQLTVFKGNISRTDLLIDRRSLWGARASAATAAL